MFGERVGEIRMLCQEDVYTVISLELISDESLAVTMKYGIITEAFILYK